jgi:hypothetical protein
LELGVVGGERKKIELSEDVVLFQVAEGELANQRDELWRAPPG